MPLPEPIAVFVFCATFLWCYAGVLLFGWFRAVRRTEENMHVGHFATLMGELVPGAVVAVITVMVGAVVGLPSVVVFISFIVPAGLVYGLYRAVTDLRPAPLSIEAQRIVLAGILTGLVYLDGRMV